MTALNTTSETFTGKAQLAASGTPTPVVTLTDTSQDFTAGPSGLAFATDGSLWVANNVANSLVKYPADHLHTGGLPTVTISGPSFNFPEGIAFDAQENLWVANTAAGGVRGKHAAEFAAGANVVRLDDDVAEVFHTPESVNAALRVLVHLIKAQAHKVAARRPWTTDLAASYGRIRLVSCDSRYPVTN